MERMALPESVQYERKASTERHCRKVVDGKKDNDENYEWKEKNLSIEKKKRKIDEQIAFFNFKGFSMYKLQNNTEKMKKKKSQ